MEHPGGLQISALIEQPGEAFFESVKTHGPGRQHAARADDQRNFILARHQGCRVIGWQPETVVVKERGARSKEQRARQCALKGRRAAEFLPARAGHERRDHVFLGEDGLGTTAAIFQREQFHLVALLRHGGGQRRHTARRPAAFRLQICDGVDNFQTKWWSREPGAGSGADL